MNKKEKTSIYFLLFGLLLGLGSAMATLLIPATKATLPSGAVATVAGHPIRLSEYERALNAVERDSGEVADATRRRQVLERLIDEQLLMAYGLDQGLVRSDRRLSANLVSAVLELLSVEAETRVIPDNDAEAFFKANSDYFRQPSQMHIQVFLLESEDAATRMRLDWLAGHPAESLIAGYQARIQTHIPDALLPASKLRQLAGASLVTAANRLSPGEISAPIALNAGYYLVRLMDRREHSPRYAEVAEQVKSEMRRRSAEQAVRQTLQRLREDYPIRIDESRL